MNLFSPSFALFLACLKILTVTIESAFFSKIKEPPQDSIRQKNDMKQIPY
jgi:hypothetical protein